jgi:hypothetical protein
MINATSNNNSSTREIIPAGNYVARCFSMIHIGTVEEEIKGVKKELNKVRVTWEIPGETRVFDPAKGAQPMVINKEYTLSMYKLSHLRHDLESWRGQAFTDQQAGSFDITRLLDIPCMLNIIHDVSKAGKKYALISTISPLPKGLLCPLRVNPLFEWNFEDKYDANMLESFPDFIKDKIKSSREYKELTSNILYVPGDDTEFTPEAVPYDFTNDLPF